MSENRCHIGIKSDPIEYRYSYDWLFDLLLRHDIHYMQLGSFFEMYSLDDDYFLRLADNARAHGVAMKSVFTSHRELGGFFTSDKAMERVARKNYERLIDIAALVGADYAGSNPGAAYRDREADKTAGIECYLAHMKDLMAYAHARGLRALTIEPMSCHAEPPSLPGEIDYMMRSLSSYHLEHRGTTVPVYLCGDISHGVASREGTILHDNYELFAMEIPYMCEFHFKNTDRIFNKTFGFTDNELAAGIVDLERVFRMVAAGTWPVNDIIGYLEIGGPKLGRDYSDHLLESALTGSFDNIKKSSSLVFGR
ncbi:MAG: TIM barrel protein [Spirochaetota bacterium]